MLIGSWLKNWGSGRRSANRTTTNVVAESLETRSLLSVSALYVGNELTVVSDGNDSIRVSAIGGKVLLETGPAGGFLTPYAGIGSIPASSVQAITIDGGDQENVIDLGSVSSADFTNLTSIVVRGHNGDDRIIGSLNIADSLSGGDGNDTLIGQGGGDTLDGGDGADLIDGDGGADSVLGGNGADTITSGGGNDTVDGGNGSDLIDLGGGNDSVFGGNGEETIFGGDGNDTINGDGGADQISGDAGDDSILGGELDDSIQGGDGNDTVNGQGGNDLIAGDAGVDSLLGGAGHDRIGGGTENDLVNGGAGNDTLEGGLGNDRILGGSNNDLMFDDSESGVVGNDTADTILGQGGDDTIVAVAGPDLLDGGDGNDLIDNRVTSVSVNDARLTEGDAGTTNMTFTITLSSTLSRVVTVSFATSNGTATTTVGGTSPQDNEDYQPVSGTVTFAPGEFTKTVNVPIVGDTFDESDEETLFLNLTSATNAAIFDGLGEGRILDDDAGSSGPIDVFLLLDDTSSFEFSGPEIIAAFPQFIANLQAAFPGVTLGFGVGRFEEYLQGANQAGAFMLNQPIIVDSTPNFQLAIDAALNRTAPSGGGGRDETAFEALHQIATGVGFVGNGDGDTTDNGAAGLVSTQLAGGGTTGDVPAYSTFTPDPTGDPAGPVLPPTQPVAGTTNGVGFRTGAQHIVIMASDAFGWDYGDDGLANYTGVGGVTVPSSTLLFGAVSSGTTGAAQVQQSINEAIAEGIQVITLAPQAIASGVQAQSYRAMSQLTGAVNQTTGALENNITPGPSADDIQPGEPLFFSIPFGNPTLLALTLSNAITGAAVAPAPPPPAPPPPPPAVTGPQGDTIIGGTGNDTVFSGEFDDVINGGAGNDQLDGGAGNDTILGGSGDDSLQGFSGDDLLNGQGGRDTLDGGVGHDTTVWDGVGSSDDLITDNFGDNTLVVNGTGLANTFDIGKDVDQRLTVTESGKTVTLGPTFNRVLVNGNGGNDIINVGNLKRVAGMLLEVHGGFGDDTITGSGELGNVRVLLDGGDGNDSIQGGDGDETLTGGTGNDILKGGAGNDTLRGNEDDDYLDGGLGNDALFGDAGADSIRGNAGNDIAEGGDDNDSIDGGDGNDTLNGQAGNDSLLGNIGNDSLLGDIGMDTLSGGDGNDVIDGGRNDDVISGGLGDDRIRGDHGNDVINGDDGNDFINGGDGNDTILGGLGNDGLNGGNGNDNVNGGANNDTLLGGDGKDTLRGGAGADILLGEDGDDNIDGQSGADTVAGNQGVDVIIDPLAEINENFVLADSIRILLQVL